MKRSLPPLFAIAPFMFCCGISVQDARAVLVVADFNDIASGAVNGKAGGTGFTGSWSGSSGGSVSTTNLTSTLYNVPQSGTGQRLRGQNSTGLRQNFRTLATTPTNEVWFSFLAQVETGGGQAGLSFNSPTGTPFDNPGTVYAYFQDTSLLLSFGAGTAATVTDANVIGSTTLVVGRFVINGGGLADTVSLWVNPDLIANSDINTYTPVYSSNSVDALDSITHIGAVVARNDAATSGGGGIDNIRISDGGGDAMQAYLDVTNIPEPSVAGLLATLGIASTLRRRR